MSCSASGETTKKHSHKRHSHFKVCLFKHKWWKTQNLRSCVYINSLESYENRCSRQVWGVNHFLKWWIHRNGWWQDCLFQNQLCTSNRQKINNAETKKKNIFLYIYRIGGQTKVVQKLVLAHFSTHGKETKTNQKKYKEMGSLYAPSHPTGRSLRKCHRKLQISPLERKITHRNHVKLTTRETGRAK